MKHPSDHNSDQKIGNDGSYGRYRGIVRGGIICGLLAAAILSTGCAHVRHPFYMGRIPDVAEKHGAQRIGVESVLSIENTNVLFGVDIGNPHGYKFAQGPVHWPSMIGNMVLFTPLYPVFVGPVRQNRDPEFDDLLQQRMAEWEFDHREDLKMSLTESLKEAGFRSLGMERIDSRRLFPIHILRATDIRDFGDDMRNKYRLPVTMVIPYEPVKFDAADHLVFLSVRYELVGGRGWRPRARLHAQVALAVCAREDWVAFCEKVANVRPSIDVFPQRKRGSWLAYPNWDVAWGRMKDVWDVSVEHGLLEGFEVDVFSIPPSKRMRKAAWTSPASPLRAELMRMNGEIAQRVTALLAPCAD